MVSRSSWANSLLSALGDPHSGANVQSIVEWQGLENTSAAWNPLATTLQMPGSTQFNSIGVQNYPNEKEGITATKDTLRDGQYNDILGALRSGKGLVGSYAGLSTWSGGYYNSVTGGGNNPSNKVSSNATAQTTAAINCPSFWSNPIAWGACKGVAGSPFGTFLTNPVDALERIGLVMFGALLILVGIAILGFGPARAVVGTGAGISRDTRTVARIAGIGSSAGPPDDDKKEERASRLALAERNVALGERKQGFREQRELRLSRGSRHTGHKEPNPEPAHS
jgi:hypothetical protein